MTKISKSYDWCMGHQLLHHKGKCNRPHGHNYKAVVEVEGDIDRRTGMVVDFYVLDECIKHHIEAWDHQFMKHVDDIRKVDGAIQVAWEPTAERIAEALASLASIGLRKKCNNVTQVTVTVWETPKCSATVTHEVRQ